MTQLEMTPINSSDILFAPHKTPNFNLKQVRMKRGDQREILIENFQPSAYMLAALAAVRNAAVVPQ